MASLILTAHPTMIQLMKDRKLAEEHSWEENASSAKHYKISAFFTTYLVMHSPSFFSIIKFQLTLFMFSYSSLQLKGSLDVPKM